MRARQLKNGDVAVRSVIVRIFRPRNKGSVIRKYIAPNGRVLTEEGIAGILEQQIALVEKAYPKHEYRLVELGVGRFNIVWECERENDESQQTRAACAQ